MFLSHRLGCKDRLKRGDNELVLRFRSPWVEAKREEKENGGPMQLCKCPRQDEGSSMGRRVAQDVLPKTYCRRRVALCAL